MKIYFSLVINIILLSISFLTTATPQLNRYTSLDAWQANSFWIETDKSLVLIDAQLLKSDATKLAAAMKSTGKPLAAVFITHPHTDHFAGLATFKEQFGSFPIYASETTSKQMPIAMETFLNGGFAKTFGERVERRLVEPSNMLENNQVVSIDGVEFAFADLGPGESEANSIVSVPSQNWLFSGDVTLHHMHYFLGEGHSSLVLQQLKNLKQQFANYTFYTGHGEPMSATILDDQINYVELTYNLVKTKLDEKVSKNELPVKLSQQDHEEIVQEINRNYPYYGSYGFKPEDFISWNVQGVEAELSAELSNKK
jgi:glyoxylase-like metal-dependent hydrolase (beta-lactamase superfamily II)